MALVQLTAPEILPYTDEHERTEKAINYSLQSLSLSHSLIRSYIQ
jgi:hypothetical protein